jgi:hypothetical protein
VIFAHVPVLRQRHEVGAWLSTKDDSGAGCPFVECLGAIRVTVTANGHQYGDGSLPPFACSPRWRTRTTTKPPPAPPPNLCGLPSNPWGYNFCGGAPIYSPQAGFCSYVKCVANFPNGKGYVEECEDGMYCKSGGISGSCSQHGGNLAELYEN